jgi:hypothetical protein
MTMQEIQRLREAQPFEPFRMLPADGKYYDVPYPENFAFTGKGRLVAIAMPDDSFVTLDLLLVTGIRKSIPKRANGARRRAS